MMPSILTICVNYKNDLETISFINSLFSLKSYENQVAIVVSNQPLSRSLQNDFNPKIAKNVVVKYSDENLGYFGGANWGLEEYRKDHNLPEWVIVSNTDIVFPDSDLFLKLKNYNLSNAYAVIAPQIELDPQDDFPSTRMDQNPFMIKRPSKLRMKFIKNVFRSSFSYLIYNYLVRVFYFCHATLKKSNEYQAETKANIHPFEIYAPFGAFIIFHRSYFDRGGSLRYGSFLFGEEIFVAETVRQLKLKILFDPNLKVIHKEHSSTRLTSPKMKAKYSRQSLDFLLKNYFSE